MGQEEDASRHSFHDLAEEIRKDTDELNLSDLVDKEILQVLQDSFVEATGMVVGIFDDEFHAIIPNSPWSDFCTIVDGAAHGRCLEDDMKAVEQAKDSSDPVIHECFACDTVFFAAPIIIQGKVMGSILGGQVRTKPPDDETVRKFAKDVSVDEEKLVKAAHDLKVFSESNLKSWAKLLQSIANLVAETGHEKMIGQRLEVSAEERSESLEERIEKRTGELRMSEILYKNLFDQSNDAIFVHTMDGKMVDVNSRAEELLGYTKEELLGMQVSELHTEGAKAESHEAFARIKDERSVRFESLMQRKDGAVIPVEISSRFFETDGEDLIQGVVRDISERARFISLLKKARDVLQEKVAERTAALTASKRELEKKVRDLEHWEDMLFEREMTISRLEEEVKRLRQAMAKKSKGNP